MTLVRPSGLQAPIRQSAANASDPEGGIRPGREVLGRLEEV